MKYLSIAFSNILASLSLFAIRTWITLLPVSATAAQCRLDCAAARITSESFWGGSWNIWETQRLVGPTEPSAERNATYPLARAPFPLPFSSFCQLGCSFFFAGSPRNTTCKARCDQYYTSNVSVGISDFAQKARLECRDGCDIAVLRCQPGYLCVDGAMSTCPAGTYRSLSYDMVTSCTECPRGTYREKDKGRGVDDCSSCPVNTYQNLTGATSKEHCLRCPDGYYAEVGGAAECTCVTPDSCLSEWQNSQRNSMPFVGRS